MKAIPAHPRSMQAVESINADHRDDGELLFTGTLRDGTVEDPVIQTGLAAIVRRRGMAGRMSTFILWPETGPGPWAGVLHRAADLDTARDMTTTPETAYRALT